MKKNKAFTMFEISLVFAIVTVIVAVSIRITKAKFDSLNRYLYYGAYSMLQSTMKEIMVDVQKGDNSVYKKRSNNSYQSNNSLDEVCEAVDYFLNTKSSNCTFTSGGQPYWLGVIQNGNFSADAFTQIVLSNGMKLYNINTVPSGLSGFDHDIDLPFTYTDMNGQPKKDPDDPNGLNYLQPQGFVVYIDIDGSRGSATLWDDVFPFYVVAENGDVIPAWKNPYPMPNGTTPSLAQGAKDFEIVRAGVYSNIQNRFIERGLTYQEAICKSGVITNAKKTIGGVETTVGDYCESIEVINSCNKATGTDSDPHDCVVKILPPVKV